MSERAGDPICTIIAGPNGAGKSTIYGLIDLPGEFINADDIARELNPDQPASASLPAGREVLRILDEKFLAKASFCYETTLSSHQAIRVIQKARLAGYHTQLLFVALASADLHVQRVRDRVMKGGHDIPEDTIRRRYDVSFENLTKAVPLCDEVAIFDNSSAAGPMACIELLFGRISRNSLSRDKPLDRRIAGSVAAGLGLPLDHILPAAR